MNAISLPYLFLRRLSETQLCLALVFSMLTGTGWAAPTLVSTASLDGQTVALLFAGALDPASATNSTKYSITGATVQSATLLPDNVTVLLSVTGLSGSSYTVAGTGLKDAQGNSGNVNGTGSVLGWTVADLGTLSAPSVAYAYNPSAIVAHVSDGTFWFTADSGNLLYRQRTGDFDVRVQVAKVSGGGNDSNLILDVRESPVPGSRHVAITVYPSQKNWTSFVRDSTDGSSGVLTGNWRINWPAGIDFPNAWLRVQYKTGSFTTFGSTNGWDWVQVGNPYTPATPYATTYVGLATGLTDAGAPPVQVEYDNFGDFSLSNATVVIQSPPQNATVVQNRPATFSVLAILQNGPQSALSFQWQRDGKDIPGAVSSSYTLPQATLADQNAQFRVRISAPGAAEVLSSAATLTVQADTQPPGVLSSAGILGYNVAIFFDEQLDPTTATDSTRYTLGGGIPIDGVTLAADQQTVVLQVSSLTNSSYTVHISGVKDLAGNAANVSSTGQGLPYSVLDLGNLLSPSLAYARAAGTFEVLVNGGAIWFTADAANFISQPFTNDFDVRVQVTKVSGGDANSNMSLDARESADPSSRHIAITVYPSQKNWTSFTRGTAGGNSGVLSGNWRIGWPAGIDFPNAWLRLQRVGNAFHTYGSTNGLDWIQVGDTYTPDPPYAETLLVGLASAVTDSGQPPLQVEYSNFGPFALTNAEILITAPPQNVTVVENRSATFSVGATVTNGPTGVLTYQWQRNGVDIAGANAASYTLPLASLTDSGARFRVKILAPGLNSVFSASAQLTVLPDTQPPVLVSTYAFVSNMVSVLFDELVDTTSASDATRYSLGAGVSVDGAQLQSDGRTVVLQVSGMTVPHYTLNVTSIADLKGNAATASLQGTNAGFTFLDVGDVITPGLVISPDASQLTVLAGGKDIWGLNDSFNFLYQPLTGDFDVRLQMTDASYLNGSTRGGLMVREDDTPGSRNVFVGTYPKNADNHWVATDRTSPGGNTLILPGGYVLRNASFAFPNAWLRLQRSGQAFTTYYSPNGSDWTVLGASVTANPPYPDTVLVGIASAAIYAAGGGPAPAAFTYQNYGPTPAVVPRPSLQIELQAQNLLLSWPAAAAAFQLQQATGMVSTNVWTAVTNAPVQSGDRWQVTLPLAPGERFYRLAH